MKTRNWLLEVGLVTCLNLGLVACQGPAGEMGRPGDAGDACEINKNADGSRTIECADGTVVTVKDGVPGEQGEAGDAGAAGTSCTATDNGDGTKTITCTDGTNVVVTDGGDGPLPTQLSKYDELPGVVATIHSVTDNNGGNIMPGDTVSVRFSVKTKAGAPIPLDQMNSGGIILSGPTSNYQRVIARQTNLLTLAQPNADDSYTYTFATPIPANYIAPLNDSASFGAGDGELTGQPLAAGTYTVGIDVYKNYSIDGATIRDVDNATFDFLLGGATSLASREVVTDGNCNQCHSKVQAHGGGRRETKLCILCHTSGAEDKNTASVAGGTPGVSIDFRVMVHQIHNAKHLPSALGVTTGTAGERIYTGTGTPLRYLGYSPTPVDLSHISFPVMPSAYIAYLLGPDGNTYIGTGGNGPMPRDAGYSALPAADKHKDDQMRTGLVACASCHGDPDGAGALPAPAQGDLHKTNPSRQACGSCHTDVDWEKPYVANGLNMPAQPDDTQCTICHKDTGGMLPIDKAHTHPFNNAALNPGLNISITGAGSGSFNAGDAVPMTFSVKNDAGTNLSLHTITRFQFMLQGPTENPQMIAPAVIPFDTGFRKSSPFTGNGTASRPSFGAGATNETIAVVFSSATNFSVYGSASTTPADYVVGAASGNFVDVTFAGQTFKVTQGTTAFANGDRFYFEALPTAASYTMNLAADYSFELLGYATAGADVFNVGNLPLYWGRHTVMERTAVGTATTIMHETGVMDRLVVADNGLLGVLVGDRVVVEPGTVREEYVQVGRVQTASDWVPFLDLATDDRIYFTTALRWAHPVGATIQKATLTNKREGLHYVVSNPATGEITLVAAAFTAGNPVVVTYRSDARFGWKRSVADTLQDVFQPAAADSPEIGQDAGDWVGLQILPGTYTLGAWAHKDFSVNTAGNLSGTTRAWDDITTDDTTYRTISPPATKKVLYGGATTLKNRAIISSPANCETCHESVQAHGNGRMGLETCYMCHTLPGMEDGPKYQFSSWYTPASPGVTMDFRSLMHKVHMGKELAKKDEFEMVGVFLGKPYTVTLEEKGFPDMPSGAKNCVKCHGANNTAWEAPASRAHPDQSVPVKVWAASCNSCHDSDAAAAHMESQTPNGVESCEVCHGPGREVNVKVSHKVR